MSELTDKSDANAPKSIVKKDSILNTGSLLGILGLLLVTILALVNYFSYDTIVLAIKDLEARGRKKVFPNTSFIPEPIYIIKKNNGSYKIFNSVVKPPNFDKLQKQEYIEYKIKTDSVSIDDRLGLKQQPIIISKEQADDMQSQLKELRIKPISYFEAYKKETDKHIISGWVIKHSAIGGYGGNIDMLIGFDNNKKITGYLMVNHNETPGLGVKANDDKFIAPFKGKSAKDMPLSKKDFKAKLGINSISGATITSVAVTNGIKKAYEILSVNENAKVYKKKAKKRTKKEVKVVTQDKKESSKAEDKENKSQTAKKEQKKAIKSKAKRKNKTGNNFLQKLDRTESSSTNRSLNKREKKDLEALFKKD